MLTFQEEQPVTIHWKRGVIQVLNKGKLCWCVMECL